MIMFFEKTKPLDVVVSPDLTALSWQCERGCAKINMS
jgi:hypothetical protein